MSELVVVTRPVTARGYGLAGVIAEPAADAAQAERVVASLVERDGLRVLAIDEDLLASISDMLHQRILNRGIHCVALPRQFIAPLEVEE